ncbi:DUF393 domain-containing protein [Bradymonadaceae bacterium TMQ3]|uniref:DUF393 domain-containing protein n=1 Tax=Lujinxingia sediminis TaxID=2480984 RepID=A0ABY0CZ60_9DELT|nr:DCC1-like thiol-disulfide oxidoreductase family protein [Lujinxingia sediminis]RDV39251.1 DUF393 domain-containing protein [Bradymonadaceae bacterium TMQ3]RVU48710.1 DUF393 domain-containing protein [Lujinxingia sediminis]TXC78003.1 DUF393 domain-containing protein [Bradymonadales bacterium TMQ1]
MSEAYALSVRVEDAPEKATLLYDAECGFCTYWARRWAMKIGDALQIVALQRRGGRFEAIAQRDLLEAIHFVDVEGRIWRGAAAVYKAAALRPRYRLPWWMYRYVPGFRPLSEWGYRLVANNRLTVSRLTRWMRRELPDDAPK